MFEAFLRQCSPAEWSAALDALLPEVHEVDRNAVRIWTAFFPLPLADAYQATTDPQTVTRRLRVDGNPRLADGQIDSSHWFFYGHRFWPLVKASVLARAGIWPTEEHGSLTSETRALTADVAATARVDVRLVIAMAFVGLMTLRQVGLDAFRGSVPTDRPVPQGSGRPPDAVVARRERDDRQGPLGFLRPTKRFTVVLDESDPEARFPLIDSQHLTTASASSGVIDRHGSRRFQEGPIPAQCRSATCGTCWVGVLGGRQKLNEVEPYEARKLREFGYIDVVDPHPIIRLACQARASGNVTLVIPPWHGFVSRLQAPGADTSPSGT